MAEALSLYDTLHGHSDMVTAIDIPSHASNDNRDAFVSSSRDKSVLVWMVNADGDVVPRRRLTSHSHFVQDVVVSDDGLFALSASWDNDLRLWDLVSGNTYRRFSGHSKDVLSVAYSPENHLIISGSRDRTIKLWNDRGECLYTIEGADAHTDWVSCVRFSPIVGGSIAVSGSWDRTVKVWKIIWPKEAWVIIDCKLLHELRGHTGYVNAVAVNPDGTMCSSGGKDGLALIWEIRTGQLVYNIDTGAIIHALCFCPTRHWLCAATEAGVQVWDLKNESCLLVLMSEPRSVYCTSLTWSSNGYVFITGYTDGTIRTWICGD